MAATEAVGESQLQRIIRDLRDAMAELTKEYRETGEPITDDSPNLHRFSYKLEYLLQFDQKEKVSFLGARKDYWDYFTDCLAKVKGANDGIRFVRSIPELKTSLGKGRAFIRYSLVHQRLADTLQQCLMNQRVTSDWYYTRSPLLKPQQSFDIIGHLYELNDVQFDVASRGHDLDSTWPTFARRTLGGSPAHLWKPPSRSSSINSLVSAYSQVQDFPSSPDLATAEAACDFVTPCAVDELRLELDQSELRQHELLGRVGELGQEAVELRAVLEELQGQLDASLAAQEAGRLELEALRAAKGSWEAAEQQLRVRLAEAEQKNTELLARLDSVVDEKSQQAATHFDSAQKIHSLLDELNKAEKARLEASQEAEIQKREAQRLVEELRLSETVLAEERAKADRLQGVLAVNEKASRSLERQLEDLKHSLETTVCEAEEERRKAQEEKGELQQRIDSQRVLLENQIRTLTQRLKAKDEEVSAGLMTVNHLEEQVTKLAAEKQGLEGGVAELQASMKDQTRQTEDYKTQCTSLMEINGKLLQTVKKNEETKSELTEARVAKESELAALRTLEKQLRSQIDDAAVALGEHERLLREENQRLDEGLRRAIVEKETTEGVVRELEQEIQELKEELAATEGALSSSREELRTTGGRVTDLEGSLAASRESEAALCKKLQEMANLLEVQSHQYQELEARVKELQEEKQDVTSALMVAEGQVELNAKEVSRLQAELLDVRAELQAAVEEKRRTQASREELATLLEEMKGLEKELRSQQAEKEVELMDVTDRETQFQAKLVFAKEELSALKALHESLVLEQAEAREGLHRANTETAELGITVCRLTSENHEAVRKLEEAAREAESLSASLAALQQENASLQEELRQSQGLARTTMELKGQLEQARSLQEASCEEVEALKFQMSSKAINQQNQLKVIRDEAKKVGEQLAAEKEKVSLLEARLSLLEAASGDFTQLIEEKNAQISRSEAAVQQAEEELQQLREELLRTQEDLFTARTGCEDLRADLDRASEERRNLEMKTQAEIEDLCKTKSNLEERLIELIRDKDALWQKTDALEFEQKLRAGEQWWLVDKEANRCLGCRSPFTWWLRRHHCRLCGRIFCYYCSNNVAVTKHGGKKERCCRECYSQHCAVVERLTQAEVSNNQDASTAPCPPSAPGPAPYTPMPRVAVTDPNTQLDDATFDIITTEDLDGIYDSDSLSQQMAGADVSTGEATPEEIDGLMPDCQDVEIHLLESGELTSVVPLKVEEVSRFGEGPRELFVRSSCYSVVSITVPESGYTISWVFSSEPRSVSFSVVYREASDSPLEQTRVLIPLTRCNSHQENIHGQLKAQRPGVYTLVFDNSYSRFISKTVVYHLTVEKPVIYDGSDS